MAEADPPPGHTMSDNYQTVKTAVLDTSTLVMAQSPAESQSVTYESLAHSLSLIMHNAGSAQFNSQQITGAAVARTCAGLLAKLS